MKNQRIVQDNGDYVITNQHGQDITEMPWKAHEREREGYGGVSLLSQLSSNPEAHSTKLGWYA